MAAQMKDMGRQSSVHIVKRSDFAKVLRALDNPPKPSQALIDLVARGRALREKR